MKHCVFCQPADENIILRNHVCRVILVDDDIYAGYIQIVVNEHVKELTDLSYDSAKILFDTIWQMETRLRQVFIPDKINIASLGNMVPHLHWHMIPRFIGDKHFPNSIWGKVTNSMYIPSEDLIIKQQQLFCNYSC